MVRAAFAAGFALLATSAASAQKVNVPARTAADRPAVNPVRPKQSATKPLTLSVFVPKGEQVPPALQKYAKPNGGLGGRRFTITSTDQAEVEAALNAKGIHVELARPKALPPRVPLNPFNLEARLSHRVPQFEATFSSKKGATITVAVFDGGKIRPTHKEFQQGSTSRVVLRTTRPLDDHATHVGGTVGATGVNESATGMARLATLHSYDFFGDDLGSLEQDGSNFQVSNHSYGPFSGWHPGGPFGNVWHWWGGLTNTEDPKFGKYTEQEAALDEVLFKHRHLVTFVAAGNDRGQSARGPMTQPVGHVAVVITSSGLQAVNSNKVRSRDGGETGLDTVTGLGLAKNAVCIGAVNDIPDDAGDSSIQVTTFTAFGPADDGRIKPDLVANGFQLFSTAETGDGDYVEMSGTSMASPTACGIGALLWEHFKAHKGRNPNSDEIKAVLIHSARDAGVPGPDPLYGWGAIDTLQAGRVIASQSGELIGDPTANVVEKDATRTFTLSATGDPIRVTVAWLDPPGDPNGGGIDDATPVLVNDLDARLIAPNGTVFHPYSLNLAGLWNAAEDRPHLARKDRENRVDNVEVIDAPTAAGTWKLEIKAHNLKSGDKQSFALVVSGLKVGK
jgi:subtilisin family serine protease